MAKALVTGATGLLGNNIVRRLLEQGDDVRVLVRESSDPRPTEGLDVDKVIGDVTDRDSVFQAVAGMDAVYHSAAHIHLGWTRREEATNVNVNGSENVADAALDAGAKLVHVSTIDTLAPGQPDAPADEDSQGEKIPITYVVTKRQAEQVVRERIAKGLSAVIVHPGFMLGPWDWKPSSGRMLLEVLRRFTPAAPTGGMSLCDVRDVADGAILAAEKGSSGRNYILAGTSLSYLDAWKMFVEVTEEGKPPKFRLGPIARVIGAWGGDLFAKITGKESEVNSGAIKMSCLFNYYSSARAEEELGYSCRPPEESIRDAWEWFKEYGY